MKIQQVNTFNYFTIQTFADDKREWHLTVLVELEEIDGKVSYEYSMPSIVCKDKSTQEELFSADSDKWIINTFYEYLKVKVDKPDYMLNDELFDDLEVTTTEVKDIIELIELGIKLGML
jgi:hypothetical protein